MSYACCQVHRCKSGHLTLVALLSLMPRLTSYTLLSAPKMPVITPHLCRIIISQALGDNKPFEPITSKNINLRRKQVQVELFQ